MIPPLLLTAQAGSRELDAEIARALGFTVENRKPSLASSDLLLWSPEGQFRGSVPPYSTDLSAAVALVEEKLPKTPWEMGSNTGEAWASVGDVSRHRPRQVYAPTAPLAILRALFAAKESAHD